ncbi:Dol-P-Glc:Glc(2)Man(9)GlcNAc(2)-PP-Dol alpha-1,2-glucosyltransferase [Porphyridium purpureum]|uniref:Dol-P-Glc:Glc(2)Man(9)GlcNAc(2)-PP-Dol alpha-1,2-glucosyltransferase n=1 Tax=Porphyridium purpureum TaxID=35688 RepID=A0A5J4Z636_PORPP|nr:Dol-P-Glc:Glc(2)Man(9)GlcNAc(2)-PP-Dol alpha-1,2-glucosyltransferase [Porphyridium purpureum]|eukprot:POR6043..scf295_1
MPQPALVAAGAMLLVCLCLISALQPKPYMDELFHVAQTQAYCRALASSSPSNMLDAIKSTPYDPAISTPPTPYLLVSVVVRYIVLAPFPRLVPVLCSVPALRIASACIAFCALLQMHAILKNVLIKTATRQELLHHYLRIGMSQADWLSALALWLHPISSFFYMMFYTDNLAMLFLLLCMRQSHVFREPTLGKPVRVEYVAALMGVLASSVRQSYMIWHALVVACSVVALAEEMHPKIGRKTLQVERMWAHRATITWILWPHVLAGLLYTGFVAFNGGVAIGHREFHQPQPHWMMFWYFCAYRLIFPYPDACRAEDVTVAGFSRAYLFSALEGTNARNRARMVVLANLVLAGLVIVSIWLGTIVHPFVLADNRHYSFALFRRVLTPSARFLFLPTYMLGFWVLVADLGPFCIATLPLLALGLVPVPLFEPRYFAPPFMISQFLTLLTQSRAARQKWYCGWFSSGIALSQIAAMLALFFFVPFSRPPDAHLPQDASLGRWMP